MGAADIPTHRIAPGPASSEATFTDAFRVHHRALRSSAWSAGVEDQAEDAVQEVFLRHWIDPDRYEAGRGSLRTYLTLNMVSRARDLARSQASRRRREEAQVNDRCSSGTASVESDVERAAAARVVRAALGRLPAEERRAIVLAFYGELTYRAVAARLGVPEGTIKSRIRSGLRRLRESSGLDHDLG